MCKTMCIVPCNFLIYKAIIEIFVIVLESWHFGFCTQFCLSLYEPYPTRFPLRLVGLSLFYTRI
jgi:hypothetical protein